MVELVVADELIDEEGAIDLRLETDVRTRGIDSTLNRVWPTLTPTSTKVPCRAASTRSIERSTCSSWSMPIGRRLAQ